MTDLPDWIVPGDHVYVVALVNGSQKGLPRRVHVSRVGKRYVIVTDAMGNEQKFFTETLTRARHGEGFDVLRSPLDPSLDL